MQWVAILIALCTLPQGIICHVQGVRRNVQEESQEEDARSRSLVNHDPQGNFCAQIGSSHDQCDAHPHKCQWNWYEDGNPKNGCGKSECIGKHEDDCAQAERCIWKAAGRWKGLCIANSCGWRNDNPRKCDTRPCKQCRFDHVLQACLPNPDQLLASSSPKRTQSNMWQLAWQPGSGTINVLKDLDDMASLAGPECSAGSYDLEQCNAQANKCMWSEKHGCVTSGCSYWKFAAECLGPCTWKSEGKWKGQCVTNICVRHSDDPRKCNSMPENQCRYSFAFKRCVSNSAEALRSPLQEARMLARAMYSAQVRQHNASDVIVPSGEMQPEKRSHIRIHFLNNINNNVTVALLICVGVIVALVALLFRSWFSSSALRAPRPTKTLTAA